jgi:predicted house-cleaning noncanonical NTP pyrophosphatase (MazG superfamily)
MNDQDRQEQMPSVAAGATLYDKLVRDRIPQIIAASGKQCEVRTLGPEEYGERLLAKLREEADEAVASGGDVGELADLLEVIHALLEHRGIARDELEQARAEKERARGAFRDRLLLLRVT